MNYNYILLFITLLIITLARADEELTPINDNNEEPTTQINEEPTPINDDDEEPVLNPGPVSCEYKNTDLITDFDIEKDVLVICDSIEETCDVRGEGATYTPNHLNITDSGTYIFHGFFNGQIYVEADEDDFIHIILDDAIISSNHGPAIFGYRAGKITITAIGYNALIDTENYHYIDNDVDPDACLYVTCDLSINGPGTIVLTGNFEDGIGCKKNLKIVGSTLVVQDVVEGIKAMDSICIRDVDLSVSAADTAIMTTNEEPEKGYIVIDSGHITVSSSNNNGIDAATHLTVHNGYIDITESREGFEARMIDILGGEMHIKAEDDGIDATLVRNHNRFQEEEEDIEYYNNGHSYVNIVGGKIYIISTNDVTSGDGVDSDRILYIGGEAEVYSSVGKGNIFGSKSAFDSHGMAVITAGSTVFATADSEVDNGQERVHDPFNNSISINSDDPSDHPSLQDPYALDLYTQDPSVHESMIHADDNKLNSTNSEVYQNQENSTNNDVDPYAQTSVKDEIDDSSSSNLNKRYYTRQYPVNDMPNEPEEPYNLTNDQQNPTNDPLNPTDVPPNTTDVPLDTTDVPLDTTGEQPSSTSGQPNRSNVVPSPPYGSDAPKIPGGLNGNVTGRINQPYIYAFLGTQPADTTIIILSKTGREVILNYTPKVSYSKIFASCPKMVSGESYILVYGYKTELVYANEPNSGPIDNPPSVISPTDKMEYHIVPGNETLPVIDEQDIQNTESEDNEIETEKDEDFSLLDYIKDFFGFGSDTEEEGKEKDDQEDIDDKEKENNNSQEINDEEEEINNSQEINDEEE